MRSLSASMSGYTFGTGFGLVFGIRAAGGFGTGDCGSWPPSSASWRCASVSAGRRPRRRRAAAADRCAVVGRASSARRPAPRTARSICGPGFTGRPAARSSSSALEALRGQVLVGVVADLDQRRVDAGAEALDLLPRERAVGGEVMLVVVDAVPADVLQVVRRRAASRASCRRPGYGRCVPTGSSWNMV